MKVIESMVMPSGWSYMQEGHRIEAPTYRELLQAVLEWRLDNGRVVGNVQAEVDHYICTKYPTQCQQGTDARVAQVGRRIMPSPTKTDHLTQWAIELQKKPGVGDLVLDQDANARAAICANCPRNVPITHGCGSCRNNLERLLTLLRRGRDVSLWRKLNLCSETDQDTRTSIWIKKDLLKKSNNLPANCWMI